jgi:hypothetical protein
MALCRTSRRGPSPLIRRANRSDIPFILDVAREAYADQDLDWPAIERWLDVAIDNPAILWLRSRDGFIAVIYVEPLFWKKDKRPVLQMSVLMLKACRATSS